MSVQQTSTVEAPLDTSPTEVSRHSWLSIAPPHTSLLLIVVCALTLRLLLWSQPLHEPANDEVEYITVARDLNAGHGWEFYNHYHWLRAPLYPLFLAASLQLAGNDLHRAALPNILLSTLTVVLAYCLADRLFGRRAALAAALLTALLWTQATFASLYMAETLFTCLFTAGMLCIIRRRGETVSWSMAALAGLLFGLATLTRSITLLLLPVIAGYILLQKREANSQAVAWFTRFQWFPALLFLLCTALTIAPWTIRNTLAYGRPILVETGFSYNLWAFNEPREDLDTIEQILERIPNPADRSDYATARGLERLREDPMILVRKLWPNWVFLTRVKPIQDRFLMESYYDSVDLLLFLAAMIFDDLLYIVIALMALLAIVRHTRFQADGHMLLLCWLIYVIITTLLTHGEARYRHFLFPALIPFAAIALAEQENKRTREQESREQRTKNKEQITDEQENQETNERVQHTKSHRRSHSHPVTWSPSQARSPGHQVTWSHMVTAVLWGIFFWTVVTSYPQAWAAENLARGWYTLAGDLALRAGRPDAAISFYERAGNAQNVPDPWLRLGDVARAQGNTERALEAYRKAHRLIPLYIPASARLGDLLRERGEEQAAREAFAGNYADPQQMVGWCWRNLHSPAQVRIDIGDGLDFGYISGVYPAETAQGALARWTNGRAILRLRAQTPGILRLRLAAPHPDGIPLATQVCVGQQCSTIMVDSAWRNYTFPLVAGQKQEVQVELRSATFQASDGRSLGILVDTAQVVH